MKISLFICITITLILLNPTQGFSTDNKVMTITHQTKQSPDDKRFEYDNELLKLVLEKTKTKHGPYKLVPLGIKANLKRIDSIALKGNVENLFYKMSATKKRIEKFGYISFPIDLGIVGYRIGFISETNIDKIKSINSIEEFKKFSILQGLGWLDTKILRHHGFNVITGSSYEGLFKMVTKNRGDIFTRGANELYNEWNTYKYLNKLSYDKSIALYYPLPRFFFTSKKNKKAIKRIKEGLIMAYNDGSLKKLWKQYYWDSIVFAKLNERKIFKITNPFLDGIDKSYEKYIFTP